MARSPTIRVAWPALVSTAACLIFAGARLYGHGWRAEQLAELGTRYTLLDPRGTEGYDGQFSYMIAVDPDPGSVAPHLDRPAYRYQRILLPLAARLLAFGDRQVIPWSLLLLGLASTAAGTAAVARLMLDHGQWEGYALAYGLWVGVVASVGLFLHEGLAFGLVALGWLALRRSRVGWGAAALGLSLFAKEAALPFVLAALAMKGTTEAATRRSRIGLLCGLGAFGLWQVWLWRIFGEPGIGSGGSMSTPFEFIPLMGFARIAQVSLPAFALLMVIFAPMVIVPALWGVGSAIRRLRSDRWQAEAWALLLNGLVILFVPFSTAREPLGLVRLATGLVLSVSLYAAVAGLRRVLNLSLFWTPMLALLVRR